MNRPAPDNQSAGTPGPWRRLLRAHAAVPLVLSAFFLVVVPSAYHRFANFNGSTCPTSLLPDAIVPTGAFIAVTMAFLLGGLLGKLARPAAHGNQSQLLTAQIGLTLLMAALTFAWWYETRAVASGGTLEPITYYVMCIKNTENDWTLLIFMIGALLVGRWLWHQPGDHFS